MVNIIYHKESYKELIFLSWNHKITEQTGYKNIKLINLKKMLNSINVRGTDFHNRNLLLNYQSKRIRDLNY